MRSGLVSPGVVGAVVLTVLAGAGIALRSRDAGVALTRDSSFQIIRPGDGQRVAADFVLSWAPGHEGQRFAVVVDSTPPRVGSRVLAGPTTLIVTGTAVRLSVPPRIGGSPTARDYHQILVFPLDAQNRRINEELATVHVRAQT